MASEAVPRAAPRGACDVCAEAAVRWRRGGVGVCSRACALAVGPETGETGEKRKAGDAAEGEPGAKRPRVEGQEEAEEEDWKFRRFFYAYSYDDKAKRLAKKWTHDVAGGGKRYIDGAATANGVKKYWAGVEFSTKTAEDERATLVVPESVRVVQVTDDVPVGVESPWADELPLPSLSVTSTTTEENVAGWLAELVRVPLPWPREGPLSTVPVVVLTVKVPRREVKGAREVRQPHEMGVVFRGPLPPPPAGRPEERIDTIWKPFVKDLAKLIEDMWSVWGGQEVYTSNVRLTVAPRLFAIPVGRKAYEAFARHIQGPIVAYAYGYPVRESDLEWGEAWRVESEQNDKLEALGIVTAAHRERVLGAARERLERAVRLAGELEALRSHPNGATAEELTQYEEYVLKTIGELEGELPRERLERVARLVGELESLRRHPAGPTAEQLAQYERDLLARIGKLEGELEEASEEGAVADAAFVAPIQARRAARDRAAAKEELRSLRARLGFGPPPEFID